MLFADGFVLGSTNPDKVECKAQNWRKVLEVSGLKISRKKTKYI